MKISECMSRDPHTIAPDQSIQQAAALMTELDVGMLPIAENDRLIGTLTDRDIVVRCVCEGKGLDTPVRDIMSESVKYCYEDSEDTEVARNMAELRVRRLPVVTRDKQLVGIVSIGDLAQAHTDSQALGDALEGVTSRAA